MYMPTLPGYDAWLEEPYQRGWDVAEAIEDRRAVIDQQSVSAVTRLDDSITGALDHPAWLLTGDDDPGAAKRHYGHMALEDFKSLCRAKGLDLAELETALTDYVANYYGG